MIDNLKNKIIKFRKPDYSHLDFCHHRNLEDFSVGFVDCLNIEPFYIVLDIVPNTLDIEKKYYRNFLLCEEISTPTNYLDGFYLKLLIVFNNEICYIWSTREKIEDGLFEIIC